ncbi:MAG: hypothetical protein AAF560_00080 [Acidobacteriota bacterium]
MTPGYTEAIAPRSIVILYLSNPSEKYWGILESLTPIGVTLRALNLSSFDDWTRTVVSEDIPSIGLTTVFFPLARVERLFLDEQVGQVESMSQSFERRVGQSVEEYLGLVMSPSGPAN